MVCMILNLKDSWLNEESFWHITSISRLLVVLATFIYIYCCLNTTGWLAPSASLVTTQKGSELWINWFENVRMQECEKGRADGCGCELQVGIESNHRNRTCFNAKLETHERTLLTSPCRDQPRSAADERTETTSLSYWLVADAVWFRIAFCFIAMQRCVGCFY